MKKKLNKRQSLTEAIKQQAALHAKYKEYSLKTVEELNELYPILGGNYRKVCVTVMKEKFVANLKANQTNEELDGNVK